MENFFSLFLIGTENVKQNHIILNKNKTVEMKTADGE